MRGILQRILTNLTTGLPDNGCHTATDTSCSAAGAYVAGNLFVFCPAFYRDRPRQAAVIHEMAHSLTGNTLITDRAYLSDRIYDRLTTDEALTNAASHETFCREVGSDATLTTTAPVDAMNDCQDRQSSSRPQGIGEYTAMEQKCTGDDQRRTSHDAFTMAGSANHPPGGHHPHMSRPRNRHYDRVYYQMRSALTFECERSCDPGVGGYYRYFLFITANTLHLCRRFSV